MAEKNPSILSSKKVYTMSIAFTSLPNLLPLIPWEKKPSCENQVPKVRAVKNNRKALEMEGISSNVIKFISMPRGLDFLTGSKWVSWCCWQKIDPVWAPLSEYWTIYETLLETDLQYQTINSHRFAISVYHDYVDGKSVGKRPGILLYWQVSSIKCHYSLAMPLSSMLKYFGLFENKHVW